MVLLAEPSVSPSQDGLGTFSSANTLLKNGADVHAKNFTGLTALMAAAKGNSPNIVMALLKAGADAKPKDSIGNTALAYANYNSSLAGTDAYKELEKASQ
jgi:ankyrin repeat protein